MKIFTLDKSYTVVCDWKKTRTAFKHVATVLCNGSEVYSTKICYLNRTWESYEYQSVLHKAINGFFYAKQAKRYITKLERKPKERTPHLKAVSTACAIGEILCQTKAEKNAWKKRMLSTVHGISFPEDFDQLPEDEKTLRLDGALNQIKEA
jgi:hypothetical protein